MKPKLLKLVSRKSMIGTAEKSSNLHTVIEVFIVRHKMLWCTWHVKMTDFSNFFSWFCCTLSSLFQVQNWGVLVWLIMCNFQPQWPPNCRGCLNVASDCIYACCKKNTHDMKLQCHNFEAASVAIAILYTIQFVENYNV